MTGLGIDLFLLLAEEEFEPIEPRDPATKDSGKDPDLVRAVGKNKR